MAILMTVPFALLFWTEAQAQSYSGSKPISQEVLYPSFYASDSCAASKIRTQRQQNECLKTSEEYVDYVCRYDSWRRSQCYCCGMIFTYIEHGEICTKFCLKKSEQDPRFGQPVIITLPFNFGSFPREIRLENGTELAVTAEIVGEQLLPQVGTTSGYWNFQQTSTTNKPKDTVSVVQESTQKSKPTRRPTIKPTRDPVSVSQEPTQRPSIKPTRDTVSVIQESTQKSKPAKRPTVKPTGNPDAEFQESTGSSSSQKPPHRSTFKPSKQNSGEESLDVSKLQDKFEPTKRPTITPSTSRRSTIKPSIKSDNSVNKEANEKSQEQKKTKFEEVPKTGRSDQNKFVLDNEEERIVWI